MIVYVCGVIGGSLAHSVTDYNVNLVGASGGCYALIGAHLASVVVVSMVIIQSGAIGGSLAHSVTDLVNVN